VGEERLIQRHIERADRSRGEQSNYTTCHKLLKKMDSKPIVKGEGEKRGGGDLF